MAAKSLSTKPTQVQPNTSPPTDTHKPSTGDTAPPPSTAPSGATDSPNTNGKSNQNPNSTTTTTAATVTPATPTSANTQDNSNRGPARLISRNTGPGSKDHADDGPSKGSGTTTAQPTPVPSPPPTSPTSPGIDPLSQHIFMRTNTDPASFRQPRLRNSMTARPESPGPSLDGALPRQTSDPNARQPAPSGDVGQDKKKGGSFLSRFGMRTARKAKGDVDSIPDDDDELNGEPRMDGANARVFSNDSDAGGFIPHHKEPPRYIRVRAHNKKNQDRDFNRMFLAQELVGTHPKLTGDGEQADNKIPIVAVSVAGAGGRRRERTGGAIWATEFSKDGKYLAAAGRDGVVRIWAVISTREERRVQEEEEAAGNPVGGERLSAPVFLERPHREFPGHSNEVLDLSWSKNNFLLSTSMDKTVRLWHVSREECLCTFKHKDLVTRVAFHPTDDRFFLAGSLDMTLRLWSIPDKTVAYSVVLPDLITAVGFSPDGKLAIAGLLNGLCMIYETEGLKSHSQIHAKSSRGKNSKGSKITGIQTVEMPSSSGGSNGTQPGEVKVMISTNDSRIRVYNLKDGSLDVKFKGHENACTQISASFSEGARYIISGSENRKTFIWKMGSTAAIDSKDKQPCESFDAHRDMVTTALFAPTKSRQLLSASGDPIYDLCNPPPVTLLSSGEAAATASQAAPSEADSQDQAQNLEKLQPTPSIVKQSEYSPAYLARTAHRDGNIIVTTDDQGVIKVFRQDCAYSKRRHESWETGSAFSRKRGGIRGPGLARTSSMRTRTSVGSAAHSRRGSLSTGAGQPGTLPPGVVWGAPGTPNLSSDMILSWRQDVEGGRPLSIAGSLGTPARSERSLSPGKNMRTPASGSRANLAADARKQQYATTSPRNNPTNASINDLPDSPTGSLVVRPKTASAAEANKYALQGALGKDRDQDVPKPRPSTSKEGRPRPSTSKEGPMPPPVPSFTFRAAEDGPEGLRLDPAGASHGFWNLNRWKGLAGLRGSAGEGRPSGVGGKKSHQRTASDAVVLGSESRDNAVEGPRRKSIGSALRSGSGSGSGSGASSPASEMPPLPDTNGRPAGLQRGESHLSSVTTGEDDHLARQQA